ncbi:hypothetical protein niasHS_015206 [Heterodera schachtii]|uniref:Glutathione synthetase n=1 Tax=Heterodera schachtii TaxID=97005 RepID=A0ABD2I531_HETSC
MANIHLKTKIVFVLFLLFGLFEPKIGVLTSPSKSNKENEASTTQEEKIKNYAVKIFEEYDENTQLESFEDLVTDAIDWAHNVGLVNRYCDPRQRGATEIVPFHEIGMANRIRDHRNRSDFAEIAPFSLFPSPFPRRLFEHAQTIQKTLQLLYFRVSQNYEFLKETLGEAAKTDSFLRHQLDILEDVQRRGSKQPITLLLQRSDYMCHVNGESGEYELKQVEVNIGPIGGNVSAQAVRQVHGRVFSKLGLSEDNLPENRASAAIGEALAKAWELFRDPSAVVVIMSIKNNHGHFALRHIQYEIEQASAYKIKVIRLTLAECDEKLILDPNDSSLRFNGRKVAVVYQRTYLSEKDWPTEKHWDIRRKIERSTAIVPFNVNIHLAGSKKVQQTLALPGMLEQFLPDVDEGMISSIRKTFADLWALDKEDEATEAVIRKAIENPENYVLKTNRDGGGNNFFGEEIAKKLSDLPRDERSSMILMEKLKPMEVKNFPIRRLRDHTVRNMSSELGIVGYFLGNGQTMATIANVQQGHLLRTKFAESNEGGVGLGVAVHDSPFLF